MFNCLDFCIEFHHLTSICFVSFQIFKLYVYFFFIMIGLLQLRDFGFKLFLIYDTFLNLIDLFFKFLLVSWVNCHLIRLIYLVLHYNGLWWGLLWHCTCIHFFFNRLNHLLESFYFWVLILIYSFLLFCCSCLIELDSNLVKSLFSLTLHRV